MQPLFKDRIDAGRKLAERLGQYAGDSNAIILALPRGGVPVAAEVAKELQLPLDIIVTRKIGAPFNEELAVGALSQDGHVLWNEKIMQMSNLTPEDLAATVAKETHEAQRRLELYRAGRTPLELAGKVVILIDDGIATGATMRAAIEYVRRAGAQKIVVAVPVAAADTIESIAPLVDEVVCVHTPRVFFGVGGFYQRFDQISDDEVIALMKQ